MPDRWRTVRVRLTLAATVVAALVVLLAGLYVVRTVDDSLRDRQSDQDIQRLAELRAELEQGRRPGELEVVVPGRTTYFEIRVDGRQVAATPGYEQLPDGSVLLTTTRVQTTTGLVELVAASPLEPIERSVDAVRGGLLVVLPLLVIGAAGLTWILAGRALRPVEAIRAEVDSISGSTLDRRVPVPGSGDEVARLATTMNAMLDRLQEASTRQQRFVADASHELRSPVAAIRTELEVAQRTASADDWPAVADRLLAEEARLEAVISDLLLLATLDEGAPLPDAAAVDLAEEAREEARRRARPTGPMWWWRSTRRAPRWSKAAACSCAERWPTCSTTPAAMPARPFGCRCTSARGGCGCWWTTTVPGSPRRTRSESSSGSCGSTSTAPARRVARAWACRWSAGSRSATRAPRPRTPHRSGAPASCSICRSRRPRSP